MAWWTTQFIFLEDSLISEGVDPVSLHSYEVVVDGEAPVESGEHYTRVIVSGYALYGELRGYYALGVSHSYLDREAGCVYMSEISQRRTEPISSLSPAQRTAVRECLIDISPDAWENSTHLFRKKLE